MSKKLTKAQLETLWVFCSGQAATAEQAAHLRKVSIARINQHLAACRQTLGAQSAYQLVMKAMASGLLDDYLDKQGEQGDGSI